MPTVRTLLASRWSVALITVVGAVIAAALVQLIGGWQWTEFWQDLTKNAFIGGMIAIAAIEIRRYQDEQKRYLEEQSRGRAERAKAAVKAGWLELIVTGWSEPAAADPSRNLAEQAREQAKELSEFGRLVAAPIDDEPGDGLADEDRTRRLVVFYISVSTLRWQLARYLGEGTRPRRRRYLSPLLADLLPLEAAVDPELAAAAVELRLQAIRVMGVMDHTDSVMIERLLVERTTPLLTMDLPASSALFDGDVGLPNAATTDDPCYLLLYHLHQALESIQGAGPDLTQEQRVRLELLQHQLGRPLHAMQREAAALATLMTCIHRFALRAGEPDEELPASATAEVTP